MGIYGFSIISSEQIENMSQPETFLADQEVDKPLRPNTERIRSLMQDGSACHRSVFGDEDIIYPPVHGLDFTVELDDVMGDGSHSREIVRAKSQSDAENYIQKLVYSIQGPGEYLWFIRRTRDRKIVYEYPGNSDYNPDEHEDSFRPQYYKSDDGEENNEDEDEDDEDEDDKFRQPKISEYFTGKV